MYNAFVITGRWQTAANLATIPSIPVGVYLVATDLSLWWLVVSFVVYMLIHGAMVLGCHMLLSHRAFSTSRWIERLMAVVSSLSFQGSPASWVHAHLLHHKHSDTEKDSHIVSWRFFLVKSFREGAGKPGRIVVDLMRQPFYKALHQYSAAICLGVAAALLIIDPLLFLFAYAIPVSYTFLAVACSLVFLHRGGRPRDLWFLAVLFPAGEWFHKEHHDRPCDWRKGGWSLCYYLIPFIEEKV